MTKQDIERKVKEVFENNDLDYDWAVTGLNLEVDVNIYWGDWKHDHLRLDKLMCDAGFSLLDESVTNSDGSDTYSAIHTYKI